MRKSENLEENFEVNRKEVKTEEIIGEKPLARRFVNTVKKIINLNKERKVFEDFAQEKSIIEMADDFKMMLPIFDGADYSTWKKRITMFLKMKKCELVIQREREATDNENTWTDNDLKAMNYLYSALSNRQMELVDDEDTSYRIIKKLDKLYLCKSTALQISVRNKLDRLRLRDFSETSEFYSEFEKLIIELKNAGATVNDTERLNYLLRTLPSSLAHIGDLIDVLPEQERTVDYVFNKIKLY